MKKIIPNVILIIAFLSIECSSNDKKANADKSEINNKVALQILHFPKSGEDTLKASYFADTVIYIPIETTKETYISNIYQLWVNDSTILVNSLQGELLMFNLDGKFVRKIGKNGRGPGEYGKIFHFDVIRDTIYISSTGRRSLLRYSFDGTFCDEIKFNYQPVYFSTTADQKLACYLREEGKILVYNKGFNMPDTIAVEYGVTKGRYHYVNMDPLMTYLQKSPSGLLFYSYLSDTVWNISGDKKEPAFILDIENKLLPFDKQIEFCNNDLKGWESMAKSFQLVHFIPFSSYMFIFQRHWMTRVYDAIYLDDTNTRKIKKFNASYIYDDIVGKQKLTMFYYINSPDYLVADKSVLSVLKELNQNKENNKEIPTLSWLNQMKTVKEDDNPILVLIKIKKDRNE